MRERMEVGVPPAVAGSLQDTTAAGCSSLEIVRTTGTGCSCRVLPHSPSRASSRQSQACDAEADWSLLNRPWPGETGARQRGRYPEVVPGVSESHQTVEEFLGLVR